ncbi:MAG: enoyl-[acyl-carrier-protein] reductase FabK [Andreesenia angusta]|nr:enoyl-[acyl-carrier-protein] reductase FabK [Andreesenia angusta]
MKNRICELLNIKYPIFQGGMAWLGTAELASAVSDAGGMGIIGCGSADAECIRKQIKRIRELTDRPFGVNIMLLSPYIDEIVDLVCEEKVSMVTTGAGNPGKYMKRFKENNIKVIPVVPTVALAKRMERNGADALIIEGTEAGGHIGELTTICLLPQVVDAVDIPVIAAGGIADGRGLVAAMALGAEAVQIGTRFICSEECIAHQKFKEAVLKAKDRDAIVTGRMTGHLVRVLSNNFAKKLEEMEREGKTIEEMEEYGRGALRAAVIDGEIKTGSMMAGQISGMIRDIKSCEEIILDIVKEAKDLSKNIEDMMSF